MFLYLQNILNNRHSAKCIESVLQITVIIDHIHKQVSIQWVSWILSTENSQISFFLTRFSIPKYPKKEIFLSHIILSKVADFNNETCTRYEKDAVLIISPDLGLV